MPPGHGILNIDGRRDSDGEHTNGSISWKGIRMPALIALFLSVGGGATYLNARAPDRDISEIRAKVLVLETQRSIEKEYLDRRLNDIESKLNQILNAMPQRSPKR
jgi:hypothetical protein